MGFFWVPVRSCGRSASGAGPSSGWLRRLVGVAVLALGGEELGPGDHLRVLLEQHPPLAFGHAAPNTELDLVVERVGEALGDDGTVPANNSRFPLRRSANKEFVGIGGETARLRHPRDAGFGYSADVGGGCIHWILLCAVEDSRPASGLR